MVTLKEILGNKQEKNIEPKILSNINNILLPSINKFRLAYGKPMIVTSGLRTREDQIRIYKQKGITDLSKIPFGSAHIIGLGVDFADKNEDIDNFCLTNEDILIECGLYVEHHTKTKGWCHLQAIAPKSGEIYFMP